MKKQALGPAILRVTRNVGVLVGCVFVLAGLSCLPLAAWRTFVHLGKRVVLLGGAVLLMGVAFPAVNTQAVGMNTAHLLSTESGSKRLPVYSVASFESTITLLVAGGVAAWLGHLIQRVGLAARGP
jgi:hypothetical protein